MTLDLDAIEARANAAQAGPWEYIGGTELDRDYDDVMLWTHPDEVYVANVGGGYKHPDNGVLFDVHVADAAFVAHARFDVPALVAEVRRLRAVLTRIRDAGGRLDGVLISKDALGPVP